MRADEKYKNHWGVPGGKVEGNETLLDCINRECTEEIGFMPQYLKITPLELFTADKNYFTYNTFFCVIQEEFLPILNHEHIGYAWVNNFTMKPLHPGFYATLKTDEIHDKIKTLIDLYS